MKKWFASIVFPVLVVILSFVVFASCIHAEEVTDPQVEIYDSTFTTKTDYFATSPVTVGIKTYSNVGPYDVIIVEPDGVTTHILATGVSKDVWHSYTYTCTKNGWWAAKAGSSTIPYGVGTFFVVPYLPLGTLMAAIAYFGAFGTLKARQKKTRNI